MKHSGFSFINMRPDPELQARANLRLVQILASGPRDAAALGTIEQVGDYFVAKVSIRSQFYSRTERSAGFTAKGAVERLLNRVEDCLYDWRYSRKERNPSFEEDLPVGNPTGNVREESSHPSRPVRRSA